MTDLKDTLTALSEAAAKEADDIAYYSGGSPSNASLVKFHKALETAYRSGQLVPAPTVEVVARAMWGSQDRTFNGYTWDQAVAADGHTIECVVSSFRRAAEAVLAAMKGEGRGDKSKP